MLRLRYGIALVVVLLVAGVVVVARAHGHHDAAVHQATIDDGVRNKFLNQPLTQAEINSLIDLSFLP